jgi:HD-like signal output (HDOD) protein
MKIREALRRPELSLEQIVSTVTLDPLISVKILRVANSAMYNLDGREIRDLKTAVGRVGLDMVRTTALALAMEQLIRSKELVVFGELAKRFWDHSLKTAAAARVIARHLTQLDPDEAMLGGLVHDLGAFYLLYRATQYPDLRERPDTVSYLITQWHESIGESVLHALELPKTIVEATRENDHPRPAVETPRTLSDVLFVANLLAGGIFEWQHQDFGTDVVRPELENDQYLALMNEIETETAQLQSSFA